MGLKLLIAAITVLQAIAITGLLSNIRELRARVDHLEAEERKTNA